MTQIEEKMEICKSVVIATVVAIQAAVKNWVPLYFTGVLWLWVFIV